MFTKFLKNKFRITLSITLFLIILFVVFQGQLFFNLSTEGQNLSGRFNDLLTTFRSIFIQAIPFVLLGSAISGIVNIYLKQELLLKLIPKNTIIGGFVISFFGIFMPVCECGNVPVARSLIAKGFKVSHVITFLLAAPILNPVTLIATWEAFRDPVILIARVLGAFVIANFIGVIFSLKKNQNDLLTEQFYSEICSHDHESGDNRSKFERFLNHFRKEFVLILEMLVIGAGIASFSQTFVPRDLILAIGSSALLSILAMILFSFVISVCSSVDAFIALPYVNTFTTGSIVSFLTFGPMIDIKILTLMRSTFKSKSLIIISLLVTLLSILSGLIINVLI